MIASETTNPPGDGGTRYFLETGFWVNAAFDRVWEENGGLMIFGYPISRLFYQDGFYRQYFERAVFEQHEEFSGTPNAVLLTRLGALSTVKRRWVEPSFQPHSSPSGGDPDDVYFAETGHTLDHRFRTFWEQYGGIASFGFPLSDVFSEPGVADFSPHVVQYFERARFEWHPEFSGTPFEVLLGHLGREALNARQAPAIAVRRQQGTLEEAQSAPIGPLPVGAPSDVACGFSYAFWADLPNDGTNAAYLDLARESGCTWLRLLFDWSIMEPTRGADLEAIMWPFERIVQLAGDRDLKLLVVLDHPPDWARSIDPRVPAEPDAFGAFAHRLAIRFQGRVSAWQIWNEPNLASETNGIVDPAGFLPLLRVGYAAIKSADPKALVVLPGLAPCSLMIPHAVMDSLWYLETLLSLNNGEARQYFDVMAIHAYGAGNDPDTFWPGNPASNPGWTEAQEFYYRSAERSHQVLISAGMGDKQVWITEMGWPVGDYCEGWGYGAWITEADQARYTVRAFEIARTEWHWASLEFVFHLNAAQFGGPGNCFSGFSVIDDSGSPRPVYEAIIEFMALQRSSAAR